MTTMDFTNMSLQEIRNLAIPTPGYAEVRFAYTESKSHAKLPV